jgi:hypothetical protein
MRMFCTLQLVAATGCMLGPLGCAGDSGENPRLGTPIDHGPGPNVSAIDCVPARSSTLDLTEQTTFGESGLDMLGSVLTGSTMIPFFWVGYDDLDAPVSYAPGAGETLLRLSLWPREDAVVRQNLAAPTGAPCEPSRIDIPVHVAVETADGALSETFDADLSFEHRDVARLSVELEPDAIRGDLELMPTGALAAGWQLHTLSIDVSLWRGGTSGAVTPRFIKPAATPEAATPPLRTGPDASARSREGLGDGPGIPSHWTSLGVWPRRERCVDGPAVDADERRFGWSPREAVAALTERPTYVAVTDRGGAPVRATFDAPSGLICLGQGIGDGQLSFTVPGRLSADGAATDSRLERLDLNDTFRVSAESAPDGSGITEIVWHRWAPDVTATAESRDAFASSTGLFLDAADHHQLLWWTLTAEQYRAASSEPWQGTGELVVFGADRAREISIGTGAFEGDSVPPPMTFEVLEGDELVRATLEP